MPPLGPVPATRLLSLHHSNGQQLGSPDTSLAEMSWGLDRSWQANSHEEKDTQPQ